ncbi:hypothetical protein V2W45_1238985 [Cenococcum geophilum]
MRSLLIFCALAANWPFFANGETALATLLTLPPANSSTVSPPSSISSTFSVSSSFVITSTSSVPERHIQSSSSSTVNFSDISSQASSSWSSSSSVVSISSLSSSLSSSSISSTSSRLSSSSNSSSLISSTTSSSVSSLTNSSSSIPISTNSSVSSTAACTGCVLEASGPVTLIYTAPVQEITFIGGTVTTVLVTYPDGEVSTSFTTNFASSATIASNATDVHLTLTWTWKAAPDVILTFPTTYVAYTDIRGGLDANETARPTPTQILEREESTCIQDVEPLELFPPADGNETPFIQPLINEDSGTFQTLPPALIDYLKTQAEIISVFNGSNIATCTTQQIESFTGTTASTKGVTLGATGTSTLMTPAFLTAPETIHTTVTGPIREPPASVPGVKSDPQNTPPQQSPVNTPPPVFIPIVSIQGGPSVQQSPPNQPPASKPGIGDIIASLIANNPSVINNPPHVSQGGNPPPQTQPGSPPVITQLAGNPPGGQSITVGNTPIAVGPVQSATGGPPGGIVIGSQTLQPGQVTTIGGVVVSVPPGGSSIVVGGSNTIAINPAGPTPPSNSVLTVGGTPVTAGPSGQFVFGTQTLTPGGPAITVSGTVLSLGPSGTIAVVNGATQTLGPVPGNPVITGAPLLTINGQTVAATVIGGTTEFVVGPGTTLTPGGVLTVSGTVYSLPASGSGSVVVVNGVTSTLNNPGPVTVAAILTLNGQTYSATVVDGTTEVVIGPGTTLTPGGPAVTISGTTYSLGPSASFIVVNGHTSTIGPATVSASTTGSGARNTTSSSSSGSSTTTTGSSKAPGNFIASGIGATKGGAMSQGIGTEGLVEGLMVGVAGWLLMLL